MSVEYAGLPAFPNFGLIYRLAAKPPHLAATTRTGLTPQKFIDRPVSPPIDDTNPAQVMAANQRRNRRNQEIRQERIFQMQHLSSWTSDWIHTMGGFEDPSAELSSLDNPLHPIFDRNNWLGSGSCDITFRSGPDFWDASNDMVWNILTPSLRLASLFISNSHILPWWDALLRGPRRAMPSPPAPPGHPLTTFHQRDPALLHDEQRIDIEMIYFLEVRDRVRFSIAPDGGKGAYGVTWSPDPEGTIHIVLSLEYVEVLMMKDLTLTQRLLQQFLIAKTLVHETSHAIPWVLGRREGQEEPYFENETVSEIGFSWENAFFGGKSEPKGGHEGTGLGEPNICQILFENWPNIYYRINNASFMNNRWLQIGFATLVPQPPPDDASLAGSSVDSLVLKATWVTELFRKRFWEESVPVLGRQAFLPSSSSGAFVRRWTYQGNPRPDENTFIRNLFSYALLQRP